MKSVRSAWRALLVLSLMSWMMLGFGVIPVTGAPAGLSAEGFSSASLVPATDSLPSLDAFRKTLPSGPSDQVVGMYVSGKVALRVLDQPVGQPGYVTRQLDAVSQFSLAMKYGTVGLIAHNTLSGAEFFQLKEGDRIVLLREDGTRQAFIVNAIRRLQALSPWSPMSSFRDLTSPDVTISALSLFNEVYAGKHSVVLQTCISGDGNPSWGRLFVLADPVPDGMQAARIDRLVRLLTEAG